MKTFKQLINETANDTTTLHIGVSFDGKEPSDDMIYKRATARLKKLFPKHISHMTIQHNYIDDSDGGSYYFSVPVKVTLNLPKEVINSEEWEENM